MISEPKLINIESSSLQFFQHSAMTVTEKMILNNKLNTELAYVKSTNDNDEVGSKRKLICRLRIAPKSHSTIAGNDNSLEASMNAYCSDSGRQQFSSTDKHRSTFGRKRKLGMDNEKHPHKNKNSDTVQDLVSKKPERVHCMVGSKKCAVIGKLDHENVKGQGILGASRIKQCAGILRKLMTHKFGWVFNQPVDPVKLNIPDYFSIITKPMDLGTIKQKLESKRYTKASQFADDVRLTFANAMRYNPPSNDVHIMAKILSNIFCSSWKVLEAKWSEEVHTFQDNVEEQTSSLRSILPKRAAFPDSQSKHLLASLEYWHTKNSHELGAGMQLHKDVHPEKPLGRSCASLEATCNVVFRSTGESGDGDSGPNGKSGDENVEPCPSTPSTTSKSGDEQPLSEEQLSPSKALRAAMLKSRFADTILKAQQKKLVNYGEKGDQEKVKRERKIVEKMLQEERLRIEAEVKAAETAIRTKEVELKLQREKEREAARLALQQMEKTVDIDENYELLRNLKSFGYAESTEKLPGEMALNFIDGYLSPGSFGNPLEQLGLFMKDDDSDEEAEDGFASMAAGAVMKDGENTSTQKL